VDFARGMMTIKKTRVNGDSKTSSTSPPGPSSSEGSEVEKPFSHFWAVAEGGSEEGKRTHGNQKL